MVERLKQAIEKARQSRLADGDAPAAPVTAVSHTPPSRDAGEAGAAAAMAALPEAAVDPALLRRERIIAFDRDAPATAAFDLLRTRLLQACAQKGWRRIGVTSPHKACGKTVVSLNLGYSIARQPATRLVLLDMDLRAPTLARRLGLRGERRIVKLLDGETPPEAYLERLGERFAFAANTRPDPLSAERLQDPAVRPTLTRIEALFGPTVMLFDLPPLLMSDDALGFADKIDAFVLVAAAGTTTSSEIEECLRLIGDATPFLGLVLNKCDEDMLDAYSYAHA